MRKIDDKKKKTNKKLYYLKKEEIKKIKILYKELGKIKYRLFTKNIAKNKIQGVTCPVVNNQNNKLKI